MSSTPNIRVRFAPSPTGYLHVGGARTALLDWLFARKYRGVFILRIEDTDVERSSEEMTAGILEALTWMGLNWDEGPYYQSRRLDMYRQAGQRLVASGHAYYCTCPPGAHDLACRERGQREGTGAVRFRVPQGAVSFQDEVIGEISVESATIEDFVLLRSDGHPTYHLSVVVDDIDMRISHVIRGADHISNTPKQILLYRAMDAALPAFAHVPLILGPDKTRLSKRHGATSVMAYQEQGIVPEAFRNFLALLGWSPGTDQEMFGDEELIQAFSLEGISKANAVFNPEKLSWFNAQYLARLPDEKLVRHLRPEFEKAGLWRDSLEKEDADRFKLLLDALRPRSKTLHDVVRQSRPFLAADLEYDQAAVAKASKEPQIRQHLQTLAGRLDSAPEFNLQTAEAAVRGLAEELGIKPAILMNASRVALTGLSVSPGIFEVMMILGREKAVHRLRNF
jgi:glutamyl-tRNA synthetase